MVDHLKSLSVQHIEIFYQQNSSNHENCNDKYFKHDETAFFEIYFSDLRFFLRRKQIFEFHQGISFCSFHFPMK